MPILLRCCFLWAWVSYKYYVLHFDITT